VVKVGENVLHQVATQTKQLRNANVEKLTVLLTHIDRCESRQDFLSQLFELGALFGRSWQFSLPKARNVYTVSLLPDFKQQQQQQQTNQGAATNKKEELLKEFNLFENLSNHFVSMSGDLFERELILQNDIDKCLESINSKGWIVNFLDFIWISSNKKKLEEAKRKSENRITDLRSKL